MEFELHTNLDRSFIYNVAPGMLHRSIAPFFKILLICYTQYFYETPGTSLIWDDDMRSRMRCSQQNDYRDYIKVEFEAE